MLRSRQLSSPISFGRRSTTVVLLLALLISSEAARSSYWHQGQAGSHGMILQKDQTGFSVRRLQQAAATATAGGASASAGGGAASTSVSTGGYVKLKPTTPATSSSSSSSSASASASSSSSSAPPSTPPSTPPSNPLEEIFDTIEEALENIPELSIFLKLIKEVLGAKVSPAKTIATIFCPTNAAFEALAETLGKDIEELLKIPIIKQIILYHIIPELKEIAEFAIGEFIETLLQKELGIKVDVVKALTEIFPTGGPPADVILKDIKAGEALLQVIGGVLIPTSLVKELQSVLQLGEGIVEAAAPEVEDDKSSSGSASDLSSSPSPEADSSPSPDLSALQSLLGSSSGSPPASPAAAGR